MPEPTINKQEYARTYYLKHREIIRARSKARYDAKRGEILTQQKERRDSNLELFREIEKRRYWERVDAMREKSKAYYRENKASHYKAVQQYRQSHREQEKAWKKKWVTKHPEQRRVAVRNNRDVRRRKGNGRFTLEQLLAKYEFHGWRCYLCRVPVTLKTSHPDHRKPLGRGGSNWIANIAPACISCNLHKNRRTESEYRALMTTHN